MTALDKQICMNYFSPKSAAERYVKSRTRFHSSIVKEISKVILPENYQTVLDVACGTGFSTTALTEVSQRIVGIDISDEMLAFCAKGENLEYVLASAENLPFDKSKFDLITISDALHWLDRDRFFSEAARVLKPNSWLVAYNTYFSGQVLGNTDFNVWFRQQYLKEFPSPPRAKISFENENRQSDFVLIKENWNENFAEFSLPETVDYLMTQSNVITLVEGGAQTIENVAGRLTAGIEKFFEKDTKKLFLFNTVIWYLRRKTIQI